MNKKKYSQTVIFLGVLVVIGLVLFYHFTKDNNQSLNSIQKIDIKEFNNSFYSLKYPANWYIDPQDNEFVLKSFPLDQTPPDIINGQWNHSPVPKGGAIIQIWGGKTALNLDENVKTEVRALGQSFDLISVSDFNTSNAVGKKLVIGPNKNPGMPALKEIKIILYKGNNSYTLWLRYYNGDPKETYFNQTFDQLSNSFRFASMR